VCENLRERSFKGRIGEKRKQMGKASDDNWDCVSSAVRRSQEEFLS
jgi:hypothetical protein